MKFIIFLETVRKSTPPNPPQLGLRVARACVAQMHQGDHSAELIDPLDFDLVSIFKPHFAYAQGKAPIQLQSLAKKIAAADGYIIVSPEYNHSMSPALMHLLNHFGRTMGRCEGCGSHAVFSVGAGLFADFGHGSDSQGA